MQRHQIIARAILFVACSELPRTLVPGTGEQRTEYGEKEAPHCHR